MSVFVCVFFLFVSHGLPFFVVLPEFALALDGCCKELSQQTPLHCSSFCIYDKKILKHPAPAEINIFSVLRDDLSG